MKLHGLLIVLLTVWAQTACGAMTVVKDGQPAATIVIADAALTADPYKPFRGRTGTTEAKIKLAAMDLQSHVQKITGATLPIVSDAQNVEGAKILVGPSRLTAGVEIPAGLTHERREEGYVVRCDGETLVLAGNDALPYNGTHYAVCDFLRRLGVRWVMPGEFGDVIPTMATISVEPVNDTVRPAFPLRAWWCNQTQEMGEVEALWKLRNRLNFTEHELIGIAGDGFLRQYLPDPALAQTQPDLFGKRLDGTPDPYMPNLSNPESARLVAEKIVAHIKKMEAAGTPVHSLGLAPDDGIPVDHTPATLENNRGFTEWVGREGVPTEISVTEEWMTFVNRVTEHVVKAYPDFIVTTNGYANRSSPPEGVTLHPNLGVLFAGIWADTLKPGNHPGSWLAQIQAAHIKRWMELCPRVYVHEYNEVMLVSMLTAVPQVRKMAINYRMYDDWGGFGFFNEARQPYFEEGIVTKYMRTNLMWDPQQQLEPLLTDFYTKWYGPAAAPARAFWDATEDCLLESPLLGHEDRILPYVYTRELISNLERHASDAERAAADEPFRTRVRIDRLTLEYLKGYMDMAEAELDARYVDAAAAIDRMIGIRGELHAISPFLTQPPTEDPPHSYYAGDYYYGCIQRARFFREVGDRMNGTTGDLVALAPKQVAFTLDEGRVGKDLRWYLPSHDKSGWTTIDTTRPYYLQAPDRMAPNGMTYQGHMWYVMDLDVPSEFAGKPIRLYTPNVTCEAWAWVNGEYAGHRKYLEAYIRPAPFDFDVTNVVRPGKNHVAIWVATGINRAQAPEGILGRVFLYSPKAPSP